MRRLSLVFAIVLVAVAGLLVATTASASSHRKLIGTVGTLRLTPGKDKAYCTPHESTMFQHFTVIK